MIAPLRSLSILIWGINYSPELTGIAPYNTELCDFLFERGHRVRMLTTFPYYPAWRKLLTERFTLYRTDVLEDAPVHRCWHYVPRKVTVLKRLFHEGSFVFTSFLRLWFLPRPDIIVVISPPLLLGAAAAMACKLRGSKFVFHVQDLQPDAAAGLGMVKPGILLRSLYRLEKLAYDKAARVSGISQGMLNAFSRKNVPPEKQVYFPNGVRLPDEAHWPRTGAFRAANGFGPDDFLVVYSGNMGVKQGLEILIEAARLLKEPRIKLLLCGEGNQRERLETMARQHGLANVRMFPLQAEHHYHELLNDANVCVITQQAGSGNAFFPSKLLTTLAFAKPVLTVADESSELARANSARGFGLNVPPNQPALLAQAMEQMANQPEALVGYGIAGRKFVEQFRFETVLANFEAELQRVAGGGWQKDGRGGNMKPTL
jgi:colanic acid biosynthesis glycosyl transferase WcaI